MTILLLYVVSVFVVFIWLRKADIDYGAACDIAPLWPIFLSVWGLVASYKKARQYLESLAR